MLIDGKAIADDIAQRVRDAIALMARSPRLAVVVVGDDPVVASFVRRKRAFAERVGARFDEHLFSADTGTDELWANVDALARDADIDGIVVQLPLPPGVDRARVLDAIPPEKDVDVLSHSAMAAFAAGIAPVLPPVAGAVQEILERAAYDVAGRDALVLGHGRLVGAPVALLLGRNHAQVTVVDRAIADLGQMLATADIVVAGSGQPGLVTPDLVKNGAVLIDAGTSEESGKIVGDIDPGCAAKASLFTPVPGGVGPITVAVLFKNLTVLARARFR